MTNHLYDRQGAVRVPNAVTGKTKAPAYSYQSACYRCGGAGGADKWAHTGWTCYLCGGSGRGSIQVARLYTAVELAKLNDRADKVAAARQAKALAAAAALEAERLLRRDAFIAENAAGLAQLDELAVEDDYKTSINPDPYGEPYKFWREFKADIIRRATPLTDKQKAMIGGAYAIMVAAQDARRVAHHVGKVGERIRGVKATVTFSKEVAVLSRFPLIVRHLVKFKTDDGADLTWFASHGETAGPCTIDFTVKEHGEYRGVPQTIVQRVAFKE